MSITAKTRPYYQLVSDLKAAYAAIDKPSMNGLYIFKNNAYWDLLDPAIHILDIRPNSYPHCVTQIESIEFREGQVSVGLIISGVTQMPSTMAIPLNEKDDMLEFAVKMFNKLHGLGWSPVNVPSYQSQNQIIDAEWVKGENAAIVVMGTSRIKYRCFFDYTCCEP